MKSVIAFFQGRAHVTNFLFIGVLALGLLGWLGIGKEEMPPFESNHLRITAPLRGAAAEDVEELVTIPIEEELRGISGITRVYSDSGVGSATITAEMDPKLDSYIETIGEIKDASDMANIPAETRKDIRFRQWKTTQKAILDVAIFLPGKRKLSFDERLRLQEFALTLENRLLSHPGLSGVSKSGYRSREIQVLLDPVKLRQNFLPMEEVSAVLEGAHLVAPSGPVEDKEETKVTVVSEVEDVEAVSSLVVRTNDTGRAIRVGDLGVVKEAFSSRNSVQKVNGHESIILKLNKSSSFDILQARQAAHGILEEYKTNLDPAELSVVLMDDESYDVRNRINLIAQNGILGILLILLTLFVFLDFRSAFWTAAGIPFSLCFTIAVAWAVGYTVNNITLSAIIIVLGIVVDDAIIITEYISRLRREGMSAKEAGVEGTRRMLLPVLASVLTTCVAFLPLLAISGHLGRFVKFMPLLVIMMLLASFVESVFILPSHLTHKVKDKPSSRGAWFDKYENKYRLLLEKLLAKKYYVLGFFLLFLVGGFAIGGKMLKFVLFPREETRTAFVRVQAQENLTRERMAEFVNPLEDMLMKVAGEDLVAIHSRVGQGRWGQSGQENSASIVIELKDLEQRSRPMREIMSQWEGDAKAFEGYQKLEFVKRRFGRGSGSPIEIKVRENDDKKRQAIVEELMTFLRGFPEIKNVDSDKPLYKRGIHLEVDRRAAALGLVDPKTIARSARAYLEGLVMYSFFDRDEEVEVRLSILPEAKSNVAGIGDLYVKNDQNNLIAFRTLLNFKDVQQSPTIPREDFKRTTMVVADFNEGVKITPLEVARRVETELFPKLLSKYPSSVLNFDGEIKDSRESSGSMKMATLLVLGLIYGILLLLYGSVGMPFLVMTVIPFGVVGLIWAWLGHGTTQFGFFSVVGALGMLGVVVNDSIVMLSRLSETKSQTNSDIAKVASTRLRAICLTTITTVVGLLPTAYGVFGFDSMLSEMMLAMAWGLIFGTSITLLFLPCLYSVFAKRMTSQ